MSEGEREQLVSAVGEDWREAPLTERERALCAYAEQLTLTPAAVSEADLDVLRAQGLDDAACHDVIQVVAYFNYINRVAEGVHVDLEPGMAPYPAERAGPESSSR